MHIALVAAPIYPVPPADTGGSERVVAALAHGLKVRGHRITLFAAAESSLAVDEHISPGPSLHALRQSHGATPPGVPAALEAIQLDQLAEHADRFDIIHSHLDFHHAPALRAHRHKVVTTLHWRVDQLDRALFWSYFSDLAAVAISEDQRASFPGTRCLGVVPHGLEKQALIRHDGARDGAVFLGRMTDQKRPDAAIEIARAAGWPIRLGGDIDVGNPTYFEQRVQPLLGTDATHVGPVSQNDKQAFLGGAAALIMPIDWPEPFGLVMIEALACGTPVLAARRGAAPEIVEHGVNGFIYDDPAQAPALLERCRALDPARVRASFDARFTAAHMAAGYERVYRRLISDG